MAAPLLASRYGCAGIWSDDVESRATMGPRTVEYKGSLTAPW